MKRLLIAALILTSVTLAYAGTSVTSVGTTRIAVVPPSDMSPSLVSAWTGATVYTNGDFVNLHNNPYMCVVSGTSSSAAPALVIGDITEATAVVWRPCLTKVRKGLILTTSAKVFIADDKTGPGIPIPADGSLNLLGDESTRGTWWLFTTNGTAIVNHLEQ